MRPRCTRHTHDVGPRHPLEVDRFDVLVDEGHLVFARRERREQRQAGDGEIGSLPDDFQRVLQPPVGDFEARVDQDDVCRSDSRVIRFGHGLVPVIAIANRAD
jgi:hypothetical protein